MRFLTILVVIGLCAFAVERGWNIVQFAQARASINAGHDAPAAIRAWVGHPGLTSAALDALLSRTPRAAKLRSSEERAKALRLLVASRPMSSEAWLSLAVLRLARGDPYREVIAAWRMSAVTGPNEESVMQQRGVFGLLQWDFLPSDVRQQTISDLAGVIRSGAVGGAEAKAIRSVLSAKSCKARSHILDRLRTAGLSAKQITLIAPAPCR